MKVLVVGGGGREDAIVWKLNQSPLVTKIYCAPGNDGIAKRAVCVPIGVLDFDKLSSFALEEKIDYTIVGMDDPLAAGIVDHFQSKGLTIFGPTQKAAELESSKAFAKDLMKKYHIPTAGYEVFTDYETAKEYVTKQSLPVVIKADGLALGKGVLICQTMEEALEGLKEMMVDNKFGKSGQRVVIEEFIEGPEVSILSFCDGKTVVPMVSAQDHKRAYDGDKGLNTGGMGAFSPSKFYTEELAKKCQKEIFEPTLAAMAEEGRPFVGIIYFGLMYTKDGMKVIEYNARFGDPETQAVLPILKTDLMEIFMACTNGTLDKMNIEWYDQSAVCVVLASGGYPVKYEKGYPISGIEKLEEREDVLVFHAGVVNIDGKLATNGGRVLGITGLGENLDKAIATAYAGAAQIQFKDMHMRKDIGIKK